MVVEGRIEGKPKVKIEGSSKKKCTTSWTQPMYSDPPELFPEIENRGRSRREFAEKYGLAYLGGGPKSLKEGVDYTEEEMVAFYGPIIGKCNYRYTDSTDEAVLARTEFLWMVLHQKKMMLASRQISKGFAQAVFAEMRRSKKINWASQGEWTSAEQFRRRVTAKQSGQSVDESFDGDAEQIEGDLKEEGVSAQSEILQKQGSSARGREGDLQRATPATLQVVGKVWKEYQLFASDLVMSSKESLLLRKSERDEYLVREVRARTQLEDRNTQLAKAQSKLGGLHEDLKSEKLKVGDAGVEGVEENIAALQKEIDRQNTVVEVFQGLADEGQFEFERVSSLDLGFNLEVETLEDAHKVAERVDSAVRMCVSRIDSGFEVFPIAQPQPSMGLIISRSYVSNLEETCAFCAQGFEPVWAARFSSCKHLYHDWCFHFHFERSSKCALDLCAAEMHEKWWDAVGLKVPGSIGTLADNEVITDRLPVASGIDFGSGGVQTRPHLQLVKESRIPFHAGTGEPGNNRLPKKSNILGPSKRLAGASRFQSLGVKELEETGQDKNQNAGDDPEEGDAQGEEDDGDSIEAQGDEDEEEGELQKTPSNMRKSGAEPEKMKRRSMDFLDRSPKKNKCSADNVETRGRTKKTLPESPKQRSTASKQHPSEGSSERRKRVKVPVTERLSTAKNTRGAQKGK